MLLSAMSVLVVAQSSSEIPEGLMNNRVFVTGGVGEVAPLRAPSFQRHTRSFKREERLWKSSKDFAVL